MLPTFSEFKKSPQFAGKFAGTRPLAIVREFTRRTMHGATGWAAPATSAEFYQPQDQSTQGAAPATQIADIATRRRKALPGEPEDARLTGGTRSLMRRLSGLNLRPRAASTKTTASAA